MIKNKSSNISVIGVLFSFIFKLDGWQKLWQSLHNAGSERASEEENYRLLESGVQISIDDVSLLRLLVRRFNVAVISEISTPLSIIINFIYLANYLFLQSMLKKNK